MSIFKPREQNVGFTNFDNCKNKTVEFKDFGGEYSYARDISEITDLSNEPGLKHTGSSANLHCPKTEDDRVSVQVPYERFQYRADVLKIIKYEAGRQVCATCVFASLDPIETAEYRTRLAKAENERIETRILRAQAIAELAETDPDYKHLT